MLIFMFNDVLVLLYEHSFSFNIFETIIKKYFKRKSDEWQLDYICKEIHFL